MNTLSKICIATFCCLALALAGCGEPGDGSGGDDRSDGFGLTTCQPGDTKQVDCNTCFCEDNGSWACTEMACADGGAGSDGGSSGADAGEQCQAGDTKQVDCNTCQCAQDGNWVCTEIACSDAGSPDDAGSPGDAGAGVRCQDGDTKQVDCNTCHCDQGYWSCTEIACGGDYEPCGEKSCGETCTICDPNDPNCAETDVVKYCQPDGSCSATQPTCQEKPECQTDSDCVVSGCSGQVCAAESVATTCEWREEYACYQEYGDCGCNAGSCGWAQTDDLVQCLGD